MLVGFFWCCIALGLVTLLLRPAVVVDNRILFFFLSSSCDIGVTHDYNFSNTIFQVVKVELVLEIEDWNFQVGRALDQ